MATFMIKFEGIICHVGQSAEEKDRAVVVFDPADLHKAQILLPTGPPIDLHDGDTVTFPNLPPGPATTDPLFKSLVPSLTELIDSGTVLQDVLTGNHVTNDGVLAFVTLPAGTLSAPDPFDHPADFAFANSDFKKKQCVSKGVLLTIEDGGADVELEVTGRGVKKTVPSGSTISVVNISNINGAGGEHFKLYEQILDTPELAVPEEDKKRKCKKPKNAFGVTFSEKALAMENEARRVAEAAVKDTPDKAREIRIGALFTIPNPDCSNSAWP